MCLSGGVELIPVSPGEYLRASELVANVRELVVSSRVQRPRKMWGQPPSAVQPRKRRKTFFHWTDSSRLQKKSISAPILRGAALQRCDKRFALNGGFSRWVEMWVARAFFS